jgi:hypothetical protein
MQRMHVVSVAVIIALWLCARVSVWLKPQRMQAESAQNPDSLPSSQLWDTLNAVNPQVCKHGLVLVHGSWCNAAAHVAGYRWDAAKLLIVSIGFLGKQVSQAWYGCSRVAAAKPLTPALRTRCASSGTSGAWSEVTW